MFPRTARRTAAVLLAIVACVAQVLPIAAQSFGNTETFDGEYCAQVMALDDVDTYHSSLGLVVETTWLAGLLAVDPALLEDLPWLADSQWVRVTSPTVTLHELVFPIPVPEGTVGRGTNVGLGWLSDVASIVYAPDCAVTVLRNANVRTGPGPGYRAIDQVAAGTELALNGISSDGDWVAIGWMGTSLWISRSLVQFNEAAEGAAEDVPAAPEPLPVPIPQEDSVSEADAEAHPESVAESEEAKRIVFTILGDRVTWLNIEGPNQYGANVRLGVPIAFPVTLATRQGYWWLGPVTLRFEGQSLGRRTCIVEDLTGVYGDTAYITYDGSTCRGGSGMGFSDSALEESADEFDRQMALWSVASTANDSVKCYAALVNQLSPIGTVSKAAKVLRVGAECVGLAPDALKAALQGYDVVVDFVTGTGAAIDSWDEESADTHQLLTDFEVMGNWRRGDQSLGFMAQSGEESHSGDFSAKVVYDFPMNSDDFVVFERSIPIVGDATSLSLWVYGDASGSLVTAWLKDTYDRRWQFTFGPVDFIGWRQMTAVLDPDAGWPNGPLDGGAGGMARPLSFQGIVVDGVHTSGSSGTIYFDDLVAHFGE